MRSMAESPSGLVHLVSILPSRVVTACGRDVDRKTWTRIRQFDGQMHGKARSTIAKMVELPKCDRCFGS